MSESKTSKTTTTAKEGSAAVGGDVHGGIRIFNLHLNGGKSVMLLGLLSIVIVGVGLGVWYLTANALPIRPAAEGEVLLIVLDFDNKSGGEINIDPAVRIYNLIAEKLPPDTRLRVEQLHTPARDVAAARTALTTYNATLVIWGWFDELGAEPHVELDKNRIKLNNPDLPELSLATPESFALRFTREIPAQTAYTTFFALGVMQYQLGLNTAAQDFFTQAIDSAQGVSTDSLSPWEALMWRGNIYAWAGQPALAIPDYSEAIQLHPYPKGYFNRGVAYGAQQQYDKAIADYTAALKIDPQFKEAYSARGFTYREQQRYDEAIADYTAALAIDPQFKEAYNSRGNAYWAQQQYDEAIADYTAALAIDPEYKFAYNNRGLAYAAQQQYDEAIADYTAALAIDPQFKEAYNSRGNAYKAQQQYDKAMADYTAALVIDPQFAGAYVNRGNAYADQRLFDKAIADYQKAISLDSNYSYAYCVLGITYTKMGDFPAAITALEKGVQLGIQNQYPVCRTALDNARLGIPTP